MLILNRNWLIQMFLELSFGSTFASLITPKVNLMNRIMKISLILVVMFSSTITYSKSVSKEILKEEKVTYVTFENVKAGAVLSLKNDIGFIMYSETIQAPGKYTKQFDFTLLPNGNYTFEMESAFEVTVKPLSVSDKKVVFAKNEESVFFKPVISMKDHLILISQLTLDKKPLGVKLFYQQKGDDEVLVYSDTLKSNDASIIEKALALSKNYKGNYRLMLSTNDHVYIENLKL